MSHGDCRRILIPVLGGVFFAAPLAALCADARTLEFAGYTWVVHRGYGGPGPNRFSDSTESVSVDDAGQLHLKIRRIGDAWYSSEVYTQESLGYGTYRFQLASDAERYDPRIVVGLFTYLDDLHEVDIELTRQGDAQAPDGNYTVQPWYIPGNMAKFELGSHALSTHAYEWRPDSIFFQSLDGHHVNPPGPGAVISDWTYTGASIPLAGAEKLYVNFYLFQGVPPADGADAELVVTDVTFTPAALVSAPWLGLNVVKGTLTSGDVGSLEASDDQYLEVDAARDGADGPYSTATLFEATFVEPLTRLDLTLDASATGHAASGVLQLYDYEQGRYATIGALPLAGRDLRRRFEIAGPDAYLRQGDGLLRARLLSRSSGAMHRLRVDALRADGAS
jgi:hypothetical protein